MSDAPMIKKPFGRRAFVGGALAAGAMAFMAGCGKKSSSEGGSSSDGSGKTMNVYINNPVCIDPYNCQEDQGTRVEYAMFDSLTTFDYDQKKLVGLAAESWEASDDATQFTFHLKDATFHNGDKVTSKDFKRGWERIVNPKSAVAQAYNAPSEISYHLALVQGYDELQKGTATELTGVTCPDDKTLVVKLTSPYADFPYVASHPALAPVPEAAEKDAKNFYLAPIGNGAFKMKDGTKWEDGQQIDLVAYDKYYGDKPSYSGIHFAIQKDMETAYKEFQAGNLDVAQVPVAQIDSAKSELKESKDGYTLTPEGRLLLGAELSTYYLTCNNTAAPFNNADLRRAVSMAINRENICKVLFKGTRIPADNIIPKGMNGYEEGAWKYAKYDKKAAEELLDKIAPKDASGSRGLSLQLSYNLDGGHKEIMESVMQDLKEVGISVESQTAEWATILQNYSDRKYQFGRFGWIADYPIMDNFLYPLFDSESLEGDNRSGFSNPDVDAKIEAARETVDDDERLKKLQEVNKEIGDECPVIPIMFYSHQYCGSENVKKLYIDMQGLFNFDEAQMA